MKISYASFAAILLLSGIFTLSVYLPSNDENAALTAVTALAFGITKLLVFFPIIKLSKGKGLNQIYGKTSAAVCLILTSLLILICSDAFSSAAQSVYPEHFSKLAVTAAFLFVCAYTASMGIEGLSRMSVILLWTILTVLAVIFIQMREQMLCLRINLYAESFAKQLLQTLKNLSKYMLDFTVFFGLLPYVKCSAQKAAGLYLTVQSLMSLVYFLICAAVLGGFWGQSGYSFFTLSFCTKGFLTDRADGIFLAVSAISAAVTTAALMIILRDSLKSLFGIKNDTTIFLGIATLFTAFLALPVSLTAKLDNISIYVGIISAVLIFLTGITGGISYRKGVKSTV